MCIRDSDTTLLIAAGAVSNAVMRIPAMILFGSGALKGKIHLEDEVTWGLSAVENLDLPILYDNFKNLAELDSKMILSEPRLYFWPVVSFIISLICFIFAYKKFYTIFKPNMNSKLSKWVCGFMPVIVTPFMFMLCSLLDNYIRINW